MKAYLKNYRQSPRKVRLLADLVRGKKVNDALTELTFTPKRASLAIKKLIDSAVANASHNFKVSAEALYVKEIRVDEGITLKRFQPKWRGTAHPIRKRCSNVILVLGQKSADTKTESKKEEKKEEKTETKAKATKKPAAKKVPAKKAAAKKPAAKKTPAKKTAAKKTTKKSDK